MSDSGETWSYPGARPATIAVHGGRTRSPFMETSEALYLTSGYVYASAEQAAAAFAGENDHYIYSRFGNPTVSMLEGKLALMGGAEDCWATATGMAAVFAALMCQLKAGDRVVASRALFGSCEYIIAELLPRYGIRTVLVDGRDLEQWRRALKPGASAVFFESPSNPMLEIVAMREVSRMAHEAGASVIVDNVFASPVLQNPFAFGADVVVYSATKHIDGQGRCLGGAVLGARAFCREVLKPFIRNTGPSLSPFNAWVLLKSLETLALRMQRSCDNALRIASFLEGRREVSKVLYPFLASHPQEALARQQMKAGGSVISFELASGGQSGAFAFLNALRLIGVSNNLGDSRSLAVHPATTTHQRLTAEKRAAMGLKDNLVRISAGLEDPQDLIDDIAQALEAAGAPPSRAAARPGAAAHPDASVRPAMASAALAR